MVVIAVPSCVALVVVAAGTILQRYRLRGPAGMEGWDEARNVAND